MAQTVQLNFAKSSAAVLKVGRSEID
jgi:hypothetical protein